MLERRTLSLYHREPLGDNNAWVSAADTITPLKPALYNLPNRVLGPIVDNLPTRKSSAPVLAQNERHMLRIAFGKCG